MFVTFLIFFGKYLRPFHVRYQVIHGKQTLAKEMWPMMVILQHMLLFSFKYLISLAYTVLIIFCFAGSAYCPLLYYQSKKGKTKVICFQILIKQIFKIKKGKEKKEDS
jgi:hypothetical protein